MFIFAGSYFKHILQSITVVPFWAQKKDPSSAEETDGLGQVLVTQDDGTRPLQGDATNALTWFKFIGYIRLWLVAYMEMHWLPGY